MRSRLSLLQTAVAASVVLVFIVAHADPVLTLFSWLTNVATLCIIALMALSSAAVFVFFRRIDRGDTGDARGRVAGTVRSCFRGCNGRGGTVALITMIGSDTGTTLDLVSPDRPSSAFPLNPLHTHTARRLEVGSEPYQSGLLQVTRHFVAHQDAGVRIVDVLHVD
jgi:hypothetical protein